MVKTIKTRYTYYTCFDKQFMRHHKPVFDINTSYMFIWMFICLSSWWFQPISEISVKLGIFPGRGEHKNIWKHHPDVQKFMFICLYITYAYIKTTQPWWDNVHCRPMRPPYSRCIPFQPQNSTSMPQEIHETGRFTYMKTIQINQM